MSRPEGSNPPDLFYNEKEARKYDASSRIVNIQAEISARAIEMLALPEGQPSYVLDIGCGSGLSGEALEEAGHYWVGCDISKSMLEVRTASPLSWSHNGMSTLNLPRPVPPLHC
jgi:18S rRNA (guanine1575-N7)-methyltransferase